MKKILIIVLIFVFGNNIWVSAQSTPPIIFNQNNCAIINSSNYDKCCPVTNDVPTYACYSYKKRQETLPGQVNSGTVTTVPVNSYPSYSNGAPVNSTQSTSSSVSQCSSIKFSSFIEILAWIKCIIAVVIIPLIFSLALVFFLWGVFKFIAASDSTKKEESKKFIFAGLIGLFVMTSLWGIIKIVSSTLGTNNSNAIPLLQTTYPQKSS